MDDNVRRCLAVGIFGPSDCAEEMRRLNGTREGSTVLGSHARLASLSSRFIVAGHIRHPAWHQACADRIHDLVDETDPPLRLFVFKDRFGSDAGLGMTGTEEEWERALALVESRDRVRDLGIYFGDQSQPTSESPPFGT